MRWSRAAGLLPILAGAGILFATLVGCDNWTDTGEADGTAELVTHDAHGVHADHDAHAHGEPLGAPTDFSLYHLDALWQDQHGESRQLASLGGRVQVVAMVYTNCGYACPRILMDMKRIEAALQPELRDRVGFVMISIDPERDTPESLRAYAEAVRLDPAGWTLLTAPDNTVLELAALLGVKYRRISETDFSHTNVITVLDQQGEIAHRQVGLGGEPRETIRVIGRLAKAGA
jgi:protein SCO1/2